MRLKFLYYKSKCVLEPYDDNMESSLMKFCDQIKMDRNNMTFKYNGKDLDKNRRLSDYKVKIMTIVAYNRTNIKHEKLTNDILCPGCNNPAIINIIEGEAHITNCKYNHINFDIPFKEFLKKNDDLNKPVNCGICGNNENLYGMPFDICSCGKNICPLCLAIHDDSHKSINYFEKYSCCGIHGLPYIIFCNQCNMNLCERCEENHKDHKTTYKKQYIISDEEIGRITELADKIKKKSKLALKDIDLTQTLLNKIINYYKKNIEGYLLLNDNIFEWVKDLKNYETVRNIINLNKYNKNYINTLEEIPSMSFRQRISMLLKYYDDKKNELTIYYKNIEKSNKQNNEINNLTIFNKGFVDTNKNNYFLKIRNERMNLSEKYPFSDNEYNLPTLKLKLITEKKNKNISKMFYLCDNLIGFDEDEFTEFEKPKLINDLFQGCKNLKSLPDLSVMDVSDVKQFNNIFCNCNSLKSLPDISKWKTNSALEIKGIFKGCKSLLSLPDISKWDTSNVSLMDEMFSNCESLTSLPDISVWNTSNLTSVIDMFSGCKSLTSFPKITVWNMSKVINMEGIFNNCDRAIIPDINIKEQLENDTFLKPKNYKQLLSKIYENENKLNYNKFCEAFFIISLNKKNKQNNQIPEKNEIKNPNSQEQSNSKKESLNNSDSDKPEIIFKYPLYARDKFDLEDLSYSCFTKGISASIEQIPEQRKSFMIPFRNKMKEKFYLFNYFTYKKIPLEKYYEEYNIKKEKDKKLIEIDTGNNNEKGFAFIPYCFCLISKYFYSNQIIICLKSIYTLYSTITIQKDYFVLRDLIQFIINSIPIPPFHKQISFMIPCCFDYINIDCPIFKGLDILNTNILPALKCFSVHRNYERSTLLFPLRILINEKSLIIIGSDENRLTKVCDAFLSLLYPFEWIHTYIPILNEKNIKNIDLSHPFLIGAEMSTIDKVAKLLQSNEIKEEIFLIYLYDGYTDFDLGSSMTYNSEMNFNEYFKKTIPDFPDMELYWGIVSVLKDQSSKNVKSYSNEAKIVNRKFRNVSMLHFSDYLSYIAKTKEKKRKLFYLNLSKTKIFDNYIKNRGSEKLDYFESMIIPYKIKKKKDKNYRLDLIQGNEKFFINPKFSSIKNKFENIKDLQDTIKDMYPEDKNNNKIFENDVELQDSDFLVNNDNIYLFDEKTDKENDS